MKKNSKKQTAERAQRETKIKDDAPSAVRYPDFAARRKKIFGDRVLTVVDDLIRDRGRF
jgi:hypothetical protein